MRGKILITSAIFFSCFFCALKLSAQDLAEANKGLRAKCTLVLGTDKTIYGVSDSIYVSATWKNVSEDFVEGTYYDFMINSYFVTDNFGDRIFPFPPHSYQDNPPQVYLKPGETYEFKSMIEAGILDAGSYSVAVEDRDGLYYAEAVNKVTFQIVK